MTLLDGKKLATQIKSEIKEKVLIRASEGKKYLIWPLFSLGKIQLVWPTSATR